MPENRPDVCEIQLNDVKNKNFPFKFDYRIYISEHAYQSISNHSMENTKIEIGGVMIGEVCRDHAGFFLEITDVIKARNTENSMSNVTFTHETWADILETKDSKYPDKLIVGWYHSHPDFDIVLSVQDMHIHDNFFNQPHQVAFVIDPINHREGFFIWRKGEAVLIDEYWVGDERKIKIEKTVDAEESEEDRETESNENIHWLQILLKYAVIVIYIGSLIFLTLMNLNANYNLAEAQKKIKRYEQNYGTIQDDKKGNKNNTEKNSRKGKSTTYLPGKLRDKGVYCLNTDHCGLYHRGEIG